MISHIETFGLVYIEALSQGKPLLYTKGQGIDSLFDFSIGEKVKSTDMKDIEGRIQDLLVNRYESINLIDFNNFRWSNIAKNYYNLYNEIKMVRKLVFKFMWLIKIPINIFKKNNIHHSSNVSLSANLARSIVGKYCYVGNNVNMVHTIIGNYCSIAPNVQIGGMEHSYWWFSTSTF